MNEAAQVSILVTMLSATAGVGLWLYYDDITWLVLAVVVSVSMTIVIALADNGYGGFAFGFAVLIAGGCAAYYLNDPRYAIGGVILSVVLGVGGQLLD